MGHLMNSLSQLSKKIIGKFLKVIFNHFNASAFTRDDIEVDCQEDTCLWVRTDCEITMIFMNDKQMTHLVRKYHHVVSVD